MLWIKAFHIIFMVCWFAGIFYLPRLFVYHAMSEDKATQQQLSVMEGKLYRFITPFAFLTVGFGLWLASYNWSYYLQAKWFYAKLGLVIVLAVYHWQCGRYVKQLQQTPDTRSHVFYRWFNELPIMVLLGAVLLVVIKPF